MKKSFFLLSVILSGIIATTIFSCTQDPKETCSQDEICTAKSATVCCTDNNCVYKINGKEYTDVDEAAIALGCGSSKAGLKSSGQENDLTDVVARLKALMARVQELNKSK
jgi:hypothetical protein